MGLTLGLSVGGSPGASPGASLRPLAAAPGQSANSAGDAAASADPFATLLAALADSASADAGAHPKGDAGATFDPLGLQTAATKKEDASTAAAGDLISLYLAPSPLVAVPQAESPASETPAHILRGALAAESALLAGPPEGGAAPGMP